MLLIVVLFLSVSSPAHAMDPFTALAIANTTLQVVNEVNDSTSEAANSTQALSELYGEVDSGAQINASGERVIRDIQAADALAREAGYSAEELDRLGHPDPKDLKKFSGSVRALTQAVRAGKRVGRLFMKPEEKTAQATQKAAEMAEAQVAATYKTIEMQNKLNLAAQNEASRKLIEDQKEIDAEIKSAKAMGAKQFGKTGVWSFPVTESIIEKAIETAQVLVRPLMGLVTLVFLMRVVFYQFGFFGMAKYGELLRDVIICYLLLLAFPELVRAIMFISKGLSDAILTNNLTAIDPAKVDFDKMGAGYSWSRKVLIEWIGIFINFVGLTLINFVMNFGLAFLVMLIPVVVFCSQMAGFAVAWPMYMGGFIVVALWPVFWNLIGYSASVVWSENNSAGLGVVFYSIIFSLLKIASPMIGMKLLSGHGVHKAVTEGVKATANPVGSAIKHGTDFKDGAKAGAAGQGVGLSHGKSEKSAGRLIGSMAGAAFKKMAGR